LVEFPLEEGGSIVVEVDEPETGGTVRAGRADTIEKAKETLEEALNKVVPVTKSVVEKPTSCATRCFQQISWSPKLLPQRSRGGILLSKKER